VLKFKIEILLSTNI